MRHNVISRPNVYIQLGAVVRKPSIHSDRVVRDLFKYKNILSIMTSGFAHVVCKLRVYYCSPNLANATVS